MADPQVTGRRITKQKGPSPDRKSFKDDTGAATTKVKKRKPKEQLESPEQKSTQPASTSQPNTRAKKRPAPEKKSSSRLESPTSTASTASTPLPSSTSSTPVSNRVKAPARDDSSDSSSVEESRSNEAAAKAETRPLPASTSSTSSPVSPSSQPRSETRVKSGWEPKLQCAHYLDRDDLIKTEVVNRGGNRRKLLSGIRETARKGKGESLFRDGACRPEAWVKEFMHCARALLQPVRQALRDEAGRPEVVKAILKRPMDLGPLTESFSRVMQAWIGDNKAQDWSGRISDAAKLRAIELRHEINLGVKAAGDGKLDPGAIWTSALKDLLLFCITNAGNAPQPYADLFGYFLATFLGRPPLPSDERVPEVERQLDKVVQTWATTERVDHKLPPLDEAFEIETGPMEQKIAAAISSTDWSQRAGEPEKKLLSCSKRMDGDALPDPRFYPLMRREFIGASSSRWFEVVDGKEVDITGKYDRIHALVNTYGLQGEHTQVCMTQEHYQAGLMILFGPGYVLSTYTDKDGRQLYPRYGAGAANHFIERNKDDESLQVQTRVTCFVEYMMETGSMKARRLEIPGWFDFEITSRIDKMGTLKIQQVDAVGRNLHLLEDEFKEMDIPFFEETPPVPVDKKTRRFSQPLMLRFGGDRESDAVTRKGSTSTPRRESVLSPASARGGKKDEKEKSREKEKS